MNKKIVILLFVSFFSLPLAGLAASFSVSPNVGTFTVGSTFDVGLFLDTKKKSVNALDVIMSFPPDKLQLVSPSTGRSIINVWTGQPKFDNIGGKINLQGGIPGGINVSNGLITTLTFRVKSVGQAVLKFLDGSRILLNDGLGTDDLDQTYNGIYNLILPPPAGPNVISETHPDQSRVYSNRTAVLSWINNYSVGGYSYVLSDEPVEIPDDVSEGVKISVTYKNVKDGADYFHIKALRDGSWGGTTHFAINVDTTPPAEFQIKIIPSPRTTRKQPVIEFLTTDNFSGIDHYELKIIPLNPGVEEAASQPLFIEAQSPYVPNEFNLGDYDVIIRAYDKAGNYKEAVQRLEIVTALFNPIRDKGLEIKGIFIIPWIWVVIGSLPIIALLVYLGFLARKFNRVHHFKLAAKEFPQEVQSQLEELKSYRKKYGVLAIFLFFGISLLFTKPILAQNTVFSSPLITTISRDISNEEIFYVGGKVDVANAKVIIYLQNLQTGETMSQSVDTDNRGEWFYRHTNFLSTGNYILWTQVKLGEEISPPSPQVQMAVRQTAIQFGASRLSYETLYLTMVVILFAIILALILYIVFHFVSGRKKQKRFWKEVKEAEESIRRGFAVLRRDIEAELAVIKKAKMSKSLSEEEKEKENQLFKDLDWVQKYITKEVWDIEETEHSAL